MSDLIDININEYNGAISEMKKGQKRLSSSYKKFKQSWDKSDLPCLENYSETMADIKLYLEKYSTLLDKDISKLLKIGKELHNADQAGTK